MWRAYSPGRASERESEVTSWKFSGWWYTYPSEKYEFVSWDDDIPNIWKVIKFMFQTTNQMAITGTSTKYGPSLSSLFFPVGVAKIATTVINVGWTIVKHVLLILMSATMTVITMITPITTTISVKVYQLCIYRNNRAICSYSAPINIYQHLIHQHLPQNYHIVWYTIVAVFIGFTLQ